MLTRNNYFVKRNQTGKFSTLPERDEDNCSTFRLAAFSLHGLGLRSTAAKHRPAIEKACSAISAAKPGCCLVLGGPSRPKGVFGNDEPALQCANTFCFAGGTVS